MTEAVFLDNKLMNEALSLAERDVPVFPCNPHTKRPLVPKDTDPDTGEEIPNSGGFRKATTDPIQIRAWWGRWPNAMIGVPAGPRSGFWAIDPDAPDEPGKVDGRQSWVDLQAKHGKAPITHTHLTPGGGKHLLFKWRDDKPITNSEGQITKRGINVRGDGGYLIFPPSVASNGRAYQMEDQFDWFNFADAPDWLYDLILTKPQPSISQRAASMVRAPQRSVSTFDRSDERRRYAEAALRGEADIVAAAGSGERNNQLNISALKLGSLVAAGELSQGEVIGALYDASVANGYVADDGQSAAMATINSGIRKGMEQPREIPDPNVDRSRHHPNRESDKRDESKNGIADHRPTGQGLIKATPYIRVDPKSIPPREWLYGRLLIRKFVSATIAPGGVGKSSLKTVEYLAMASGKPLLGIKPPRRLRVWLWNLEDPQEETQRKIEAAALHYGLTPEDTNGYLFVNSGRDTPLVIAKTLQNGAVIVRPVVDNLVDEMISNQIDVLGVDPFVSSHEVAENDNVQQDMIVKEWGRVADRSNSAVDLTDHTRKMTGQIEITTEDSRGAKAKTDACRVVRTVNRMTKEEAEKAGVENHRLYFRTYNDKSNLAPPAESSDWFKLESVNLDNGPPNTLDMGDEVGVVVPWEWPDQLADVTGAMADAVFEKIKRGKWRENPQAKDWVGKAVAEALDLNLDNNKDKHKVKAMLKMWRVAGSLVVVTGHDERGNERPFIEVAEEAR